jgi:phenylpropionate dioxygenase-like ring-hydroxylating dioxygenase large terminal subunit
MILKPSQKGRKALAMTREDNDILTQTGPGTPMGALMRQYWTPAIRSSALERDGAPVRVKLYGEDFVAFRATDGRVGFLDEACPHRGVSLALGRNEENGLRCIFHGWKLDVTGKVVDAMSEPESRRARFCANIRTNQYSVHEACGVVWVFLGKGTPPPFPEFDFMKLPADQVCVRRGVVPYNWLQGLEAHIDGSHVPILHSGFLRTRNGENLQADFRKDLLRTLAQTAPKFEMDVTPYGIQECALRSAPDSMTYARIREVVLPFFTFIPAPNEGPCMARVSVPIDDETSAEWYVVYNPFKPLSPESIKTMFHNTSDDPDNFAANLGTKENAWNQDRAAMKEGHWSGFPRNFPFEDFIVQAAMGRRVDRSKEQLGSSDMVVVKVRQLLLDAARGFQAGKPAPWTTGFDYHTIRAKVVTFGSGKTWRDFKGPLPASALKSEAVTS